MPSDLSALAVGFKSIADIERFYRNPQNDMCLRPAAMKYANANPSSYKLMQYTPDFEQRLELSRGQKRDVFLYRFLFTALGGSRNWRPQYQKRGTCVGQGGKLALDTVIAINYILGGGRWSGRVAVADQYAGGRVDIGRQPGTWDGSTGFWLVRWMKEYGSVLLSELDLPDDARDEDESLGVRWTATREGVPGRIENLARVRPVLDTFVVNTTDQAEVAIDAGMPIIRCSDLIANGRRGQYGLSPVSVQGGHCELVWGKFYVNGRRCWNEQNSWSERWGTGTRYPDDMPPGSVNLSDRDFQRILASGDCHAVTGIKGMDPLTNNELAL